MLPETPHLTLPPEAKIRTPTFDQNLPDQHPPAVPHINPIATASVHVSVDIAFNAVWGTCVGVRKDAAGGKEWRIRSGVVEDGISVDGSRTSRVRAAIAVDVIRICNVYRLFIWREANAVRPSESIGHDPDIPCCGVEAVDQLRKLWFGSEPLLVAVDRVREPD